MCQKLTICVFLILSSVRSTEHGKTYEKNKITYQVGSVNDFKIFDKPISVLREGAIADIPEMHSLVLYNNGISKIEPGAFRNLSNLKSLTIISSDIQEIGPGMFNSLDLTELVLIMCNIRNITSNSFENMENLKKIHLDDNRLNKWNPEWFAKTPSLTSIFMGGNLFEEIPANAVKDLKTVDNFYLHNNKISKIDDDAFKGIKNIGTLSLSKNKLETFDGKCLHNIEVNSLKVDENRIHCLEEDKLEEIFVANETDARGNPWESACLKKIITWVTEHNKKVTFTNDD